MKTQDRLSKIIRLALVLILIVTAIGAAFALPYATVSAKDSSVASSASSQAYNFKSVRTGASGGFVVDVIFHPTQQNLIYAKTDMGGVYRWNQATGTWTQLMNWVTSDNWNWTGGESVALDPSDPNRLYIAGGTYTNNWTPDNGVILRSIDQGNTFQVTQMPFKMGGNMPGRGMGERLAVDPNLGSVLYFGARDGAGLWKSSNYGATWSKVANFPVTGVYAEDPNDTIFDYNNHPVGIPWVIFDKSTGTPGNATQTIYVGVADGRSGQPNIYWSTNGGQTWAPVPGQPLCTTSGNIVTCDGGVTWDKTLLDDGGQPASPKDSLLAKQAAFDSQGTMYVTYSNWAGPYRGSIGDVWKFTPSTGTWTRIDPTTGNNACGFGTPYWGYGGLGVDMQNPGTLVVAAVNSWWPDGQLFRSTDGGATWKCIWELDGWPTIAQHFSLDLSSAPWLALGNPQKTAPEASVKLGWMMEGLKIDPFNSNRMMYGTGATLYGTTNLTAWDSGGIVNISSMSVGMEETSVLGLVSPPSGTARLFSAVGDVGGWRHDNLDAPPSTGYIIPDSGTVTSIDFAELSPSFLVRAGSKTAFTFDSGNNWFAGNNTPVSGQGYGTIAAAADASRVLWAADNSPVSYSTDNGNSWVAATGGIPNGSYVASDRVNSSKFYGFGNGKFWHSANGGASFSASTATGFPNSGKVKSVPGREGDVWVTGGELVSGGSTQCNPCGLWHTANGGGTFTKLQNVDFAAAIGFGKAAPGQTYPAIFLFGRVDGEMLTAYRSDDMGVNWIRITDDQHNYATIQTITGDPTIYGRVYLGTNGLGIIYGDISGPQPPTSTPGGPTATRTNTPVVPTATRTNTPIVPTATHTNTPPSPTNTPTSGGAIKAQLMNGGTDNNQQTTFRLRVQNTGSTPQSNISVRVYFTLDGSQAASSYVLEKYYDQSGVATVSAPILASGSTYYFTVNYGAALLPAGGAWEFHTSLHLGNWGSSFSSANDWWRSTGTLPASYTDWNNLPAYLNNSLTWGSEPGAINPTATNTSVPPTATKTPIQPTATPTNTPVGPTATNTPVPPTATRTNTPVPPTATPTGSAASCAVSYARANDWGSGFTANVTISNNGSSAINGWTLAWTFPGNQTITNLWSGSYTQSGQSVSVTNLGYNGNIPANGGTVSFGFNANYSGTNNNPTSFSVNGVACQ